MRTLRNVLNRKHERDNLRQVGLCVGLTVVLVIGAFGLVTIKHLVEARPKAVATTSGKVGTNAAQLERTTFLTKVR